RTRTVRLWQRTRIFVSRRRLGLPPVRGDDREPSARPEYPRDFGDGDRVLEPVERLPREDRVDACVLQRDRLGRTCERGAVDGAHALVGLDGDDIREATLELPGEAARARTEGDDTRGGAELERLLGEVEERLGVRRPDAVVSLGNAPEAEAA